jgi:hypothetical protein
LNVPDLGSGAHVICLPLAALAATPAVCNSAAVGISMPLSPVGLKVSTAHNMSFNVSNGLVVGMTDSLAATSIEITGMVAVADRCLVCRAVGAAVAGWLAGDSSSMRLRLPAFVLPCSSCGEFCSDTNMNTEGEQMSNEKIGCSTTYF